MADFKAIETFMWVVTLGSFRGAAQKLNTTQPAISQRIAQLESEVGVKLLQRDRRMVLPTPDGRQMLVYAEKLIGLRSEMLAVVGDQSAMRGAMRLHASASLGTVIHMAIEGLGIAVIPTAIVENEMADGRLQLLSTDLQIPLLTFSASRLTSPDTVAIERVAELAASLARGGAVVDAPLSPRH